jgi:hypothetical protein
VDKAFASVRRYNLNGMDKLSAQQISQYFVSDWKNMARL